MAAIALLVPTVLATALGLAGCARRGVRQWACHGGMGLAMAAMLVPGLDPVGPAGWALVLGALLAWTTAAAVRARSSAPGPATFAHAREVVELGLMLVLVLVMPALHGTTAAPHPGHHHGSSSPDARTLVLSVLAGWLVIASALHVRSVAGAHHRGTAAAGATVLAVGTMAAMAVTM